MNIQTFCRCNEGTIDVGPVKNPNRAGCNVIESISGYRNFRKFKAHCSSQEKLH